MNRKEFLISLWKRFFKPIFLIGLILYCLYFIYNAITEDGPERTVSLLSIILPAIVVAIALIRLLKEELEKRIYNSLPTKVKFYLRVINKIIDALTPVGLGIFSYYLWLEKESSAYALLGAYLFFKIRDIIKEEKSNAA